MSWCVTALAVERSRLVSIEVSGSEEAVVVDARRRVLDAAASLVWRGCVVDCFLVAARGARGDAAAGATGVLLRLLSCRRFWNQMSTLLKDLRQRPRSGFYMSSNKHSRTHIPTSLPSCSFASLLGCVFAWYSSSSFWSCESVILCRGLFSADVVGRTTMGSIDEAFITGMTGIG